MNSVPPRGSPFPWWLYGLLLLAIAAAAFWPLAISLAASIVAHNVDCPLSEAAPPPTCLVDGADWGPALHGNMQLGYAIILTGPIALVMFIGLVVTFIVHRRVLRG